MFQTTDGGVQETDVDNIKDRAADMSDSIVSDYEYSYDDYDDEDNADNTDAMMPEALVVGPRRVEEPCSATQAASGSGSGGLGLKRDADDVIDNECSSLHGDDDERATKSRRLDPSAPAPAPASSVWVRPTAATDDAVAGDDDSPSSPFQTEIKTQQPLGLLAQHRLQTSSYRADATGRGRGSGGTEDQRLREMFGRRLTQAELEAAVAMQERMSGGYCSVPAVSSASCNGGLMTSLPPTPSSAGVGLDYSAAPRYDSLMDRRFIPSPPLSSASPCSAHDDPASPLDATSSTSGHRHWTFQEQFKQVYRASNTA